MIKKMAFSLMVLFSLAIVSPVLAGNAIQEPEKKENCQQKPECDKQKKADCDKTKKAECDKAKKENCKKAEAKPCCKKGE